MSTHSCNHSNTTPPMHQRQVIPMANAQLRNYLVGELFFLLLLYWYRHLVVKDLLYSALLFF